MTYSPRRIARIRSLIKARIAEVLLRDMHDPRLGFVTITRIELDRELERCKVYWSSLGSEKERKLNAHALAHAAKYLQHEVAAVLPTKTVPRLEFHFDPSIEGAIRITKILQELEEERNSKDSDSPSPGGTEKETRPATGRIPPFPPGEDIPSREE